MAVLFSTVESGQRQNAQTFESNRTVHLIEAASDGSSRGVTLRFRDVADLHSIAAKAATGSFSETVRYEMGFAIPDDQGHDRFVTGLSAGGAELLGLASMEDSVAYALGRGGTSGAFSLQIPLISAQTGGFSSSSSRSQGLQFAPVLQSDAPLLRLDHFDSSTLFVTATTFQRLLSIAIGVPWSSFEAEYDESNPSGITVLRSVYFDVSRLSDVESIAKALEESGYIVDYPLRAFDDVSGTLGTATQIGIIAMLAAIPAAIALAIVSLYSYLRLARRDMGILIHLGYAARVVAQMYIDRMMRLAVWIMLLGSVASGAISLAFLGLGSWALIVLNMTVGVILVLVVQVVVTRIAVHRQSRVEVLRLLKLDREFE